jgi:hypothetical protein
MFLNWKMKQYTYLVYYLQNSGTKLSNWNCWFSINTGETKNVCMYVHAHLCFIIIRIRISFHYRAYHVVEVSMNTIWIGWKCFYYHTYLKLFLFISYFYIFIKIRFTYILFLSVKINNLRNDNEYKWIIH